MSTINTTGVVNQSITRIGRNEPFELQVSRGQITGHIPVTLFGFSTNVGSTALGPLWEGLTLSGGAYTYPSSAAQLVLVSSSASDTSALSIQINGLGAGFVPLTEVIAINGTSNVTTVNSFLRINEMICTNDLNVGTVTAKIGGTTYAQINPGIGQTQMSIYTVPNGYTFFLSYLQADGSIGFTSSAYLKMAEYNKFNLTGGNTTFTGQVTYVQSYNQPFTYPIAHPGGTDIQWQVVASTGSPYIGNIFAGGVLVQNEGAL